MSSPAAAVFTATSSLSLGFNTKWIEANGALTPVIISAGSATTVVVGGAAPSGALVVATTSSAGDDMSTSLDLPGTATVPLDQTTSSSVVDTTSPISTGTSLDASVSIVSQTAFLSSITGDHDQPSVITAQSSLPTLESLSFQAGITSLPVNVSCTTSWYWASIGISTTEVVQPLHTIILTATFTSSLMVQETVSTTLGTGLATTPSSQVLPESTSSWLTVPSGAANTTAPSVPSAIETQGSSSPARDHTHARIALAVSLPIIAALFLTCFVWLAVGGRRLRLPWEYHRAPNYNAPPMTGIHE